MRALSDALEEAKAKLAKVIKMEDELLQKQGQLIEKLTQSKKDGDDKNDKNNSS